MLRFIKDFIEFRKMKRKREISCKKYVVTQAMIRFFEDLQITKGNLELPPFICAHNEMQKLKTDKDVLDMYHKFEMAGLV